MEHLATTPDLTSRATTVPDKAALMADYLVKYFQSTTCPYRGLRLDCGGALGVDHQHFADTLVRRLSDALPTTPSIGRTVNGGVREHVTKVTLALDQPATYGALEKTLEQVHNINGDRDKHFLVIVVPHKQDWNIHDADSIFSHSPNRGDREPLYYSMSLGWYLSGKLS